MKVPLHLPLFIFIQVNWFSFIITYVDLRENLTDEKGRWHLIINGVVKDKYLGGCVFWVRNN